MVIESGKDNKDNGNNGNNGDNGNNVPGIFYLFIFLYYFYNISSILWIYLLVFQYFYISIIIQFYYIYSRPPLQSPPDIVTSLPISTFALAQVTNKLIKKNLSLVTSYSIFIITPFFFGPKGCDYRGGRLYYIFTIFIIQPKDKG